MNYLITWSEKAEDFPAQSWPVFARSIAPLATLHSSKLPTELPAFSLSPQKGEQFI